MFVFVYAERYPFRKTIHVRCCMYQLPTHITMTISIYRMMCQQKVGEQELPNALNWQRRTAEKKLKCPDGVIRMCLWWMSFDFESIECHKRNKGTINSHSIQFIRWLDFLLPISLCAGNVLWKSTIWSQLGLVWTVENGWESRVL